MYFEVLIIIKSLKMILQPAYISIVTYIFVIYIITYVFPPSVERIVLKRFDFFNKLIDLAKSKCLFTNKMMKITRIREKRQ